MAFRDSPGNTRARQLKGRKKRRPVVAPPRGDVGTGGGYAFVPPAPRRKQGDVQTGAGYRRNRPLVQVADPKGIDLPRARKYEATRRKAQREYRDVKSNADLGRAKAYWQSPAGRKVAPFGTPRKNILQPGVLEAFKRAERARAVSVPTRLGNFLRRGFEANVQAAYTSPTSQLTTGRAAAADVGTLGAGVFVGGLEAGRGLVEAAPGRRALGGGDPSTKRLQKLARGTWEGVKQSSPGQLVQGDPAGAYEQFQQHPLISALDYAGAASAAGRTAGAVTRAATKGRRGSTIRSPIATTNDAGAVRAGAYVERRASNDLTRQAVQRRADRRREPLLDADGKVVTVKQRGREVPVLKSTPTEQKRWANREGDFRAGRGNASERVDRELAARNVKIGGTRRERAAGRAVGVKGRRAKDLVAMVVEGTIPGLRHEAGGHAMTGPAAFKRYLSDHGKRLEAEYQRRMKSDPVGYRHSGEAALNRERHKQVQEALNDPKTMLQSEQIVAEGERIGRALNAQEKVALRKGVLSDEQRSRRAGLIPAAIEHMRARHFTEEQHAELETAARAREEAALDALHGKRTGSARERRWDRSEERDVEVSLLKLEDQLERLKPGTGQYTHIHRRVENLRRELGRVQRSHTERRATPGRRVMGRLPTGERRRELQRDYEAARAHRIAVSGRDPKRVEAHEKAEAAAEKAEGEAKSVGTRVARLVKKRGEKAAVHRSQRGGKSERAYVVAGRRFEKRADADAHAKETGREVNTVALTDAEKDRIGEIKKLDRAIKAAKAERVEAETKARKLRREAKRNPLPKQKAAVRTAEGKRLSDKDIEDFLRSTGRDPETVAYLPHNPPGNAAFHTQLRPGTRPVIDKAGPQGTRTGEAYRKGATEASADLIQQQGVKLATQINKAEQLDSLVRERGLRHPHYAGIVKKADAGAQLTAREKRLLDKGGYMTGREAEEFAQRIDFDTRTGQHVLVATNGERLVPMRAYADRLSESTKAIIRESHQGPNGMESLGQRLLNDRVLSPADLRREGARNVVLVNADVVKRMEEHLKPAGELQRFLQMLNRPFRLAVLAQPRWIAGNFIEPYFVRLPTVGSGVVNVPGMLNDIRISRKFLRTLENSDNPRMQQAAREYQAQHLGGLQSSRGLSNRRTFEETAMYGKMVAKVPAVRQMSEIAHKVGQVLIAPAKGVFVLNRELIEKWAQHAGGGRQIRKDMHEFYGSWAKAAKFGEEAAQEAAKGFTNTPTQLRYLREQQVLLGKYGDFSPRVRAAVQGPMPFLPWALNAARFVYWTMPAHRTVQTALLTKTAQVVQEEWEAEHADLPPSLQKSTLAFDKRRKDGGFTPGIRYTPWGLTAPLTQGNFEGLDQALPAIQGPLNAIFRGQDPFGRPLKTTPSAENPQGSVEGWNKAPVAVNQLAEALIPYLSQARRLREGGETGLPTSTVFSPKTKPGTSYGMSALRRTFDPFRPTYVKPPGSGGAAVKPMSKKAMRKLGLDEGDIHDLRDAIEEQGGGLDPADLEELKALARGG